MNKHLELKNFMKTLNILYVSANKESSEETLDILKKFFSHIHSIKSKEDVLQQYEAHYKTHEKHYDIVIIDTDILEADAITMCSSILSLHKEQAILVMAEQNESNSLLNLIQTGISNFITKPINITNFETVLLRIASILNKQETIKKQYEEIKSINLSLATAKKEAEEASLQKSHFLANMSHEIRTPLNAIVGFISLLHEKETDKEKLNYLEVVKRASDTLLKVISDILDITKIESGKLEIENIPFDPYEKLVNTTELFQAKAAQEGIIFKVKFNYNMPASLISDPFRIQQIFSNLLSNAIKFTPKGSVVKAVIWYKNGTLHIKVKDYGIGIIPEKHEYIFEAFNQADNVMAKEYGGTGLGLALCAELTKLLGGDLSLKNNKKGGSVFTLSIKMPEDKEMKKEPTPHKNKPDKSSLKGHILVVDDIEANRMFIGIVLENMKLTYDTAVDGFDALEKFNTNKYDLILMDENMPRLNGTDTTKRILEIEKNQNLKHTPIVTLTANALKGDRERFLKAGMDDYLSKPVDPDEIFTVLSKFL